MDLFLLDPEIRAALHAQVWLLVSEDWICSLIVSSPFLGLICCFRCAKVVSKSRQMPSNPIFSARGFDVIWTHLLWGWMTAGLLHLPTTLALGFIIFPLSTSHDAPDPECFSTPQVLLIAISSRIFLLTRALKRESPSVTFWNCEIHLLKEVSLY